MPRDLWTDKRTPAAVRRAANLVLAQWEQRHGEQLEPVTASGFGTAFESAGYVILGRANDARRMKTNSTALFWNTITHKSFARLYERARAADKKFVFLLIAYKPPRVMAFEIPSEVIPWESLPSRRDGGANLAIQQTRSGPALKTNTELLDLSPYQLVAADVEAARTAPADLLSRITIEPGKRSGRPCIRGLRITVDDVLEYLAAGMSEAAILADFPELEPEDIRASLAFAARRERMLRSA